MEQQLLRDFEAKCIQEEAPACQSSCPLHVEAREFIKFMAASNLKKARQQLDRTLPISCITAYLCSGPCQSACKRSQIDVGINMPMLERACVLNSKPTKIMPLPESGKKIAVGGSALSSLVLAWELGKKGHHVTIYHKGPIGADILKDAQDALPAHALTDALEQLKSVRVLFNECNDFNDIWLNGVLKDFGAVYLGLDDHFIAAASFSLDKKNGSYTDNKLTLITDNDKIAAGAYRAENQVSFIQCMSDAKKAAGSIDRLLQNVSPSSARDKEEPYETKLYTNLNDMEQKQYQEPKNIFEPQLDEAKIEALRCIQCSCLECVKICPYLAHYKGYPKKYLREIYNNLCVVQGLRQANTMINSCAECGLCAKICPHNLNMGIFCDLARQEMVQTKRMPPSAHEFALDDMSFSNAEHVSFFKQQQGHEKSSYLFFPGCQLPVVLPEQVILAYEHLQNNLSGGVGFMLGCCGAPAKWAAKDDFLKITVQKFRQSWENTGKPLCIYACASCSDFFAKYCPDIPQISLWEILADLPLPENNNLTKHVLTGHKLAIHDPCSSREFKNMQVSVRTILSKLNQDFFELDFSQEKTRCCGYGGLAAEANPALADSYAQSRKLETEANLLVYCAICRERFQKINKPCLHILEIIFPTLDFEQALKTSFMNIFERQEKRLLFRQTILERIWNIKAEPMSNDILQLNISHTVENTLNERRILRSDIIAVLAEAENTNAHFCNGENGHILASLRPRQVTFWVEYIKEADASFTIYNAYCHRMVVPGVPGKGKIANFEQDCCTKSIDESS